MFSRSPVPTSMFAVARRYPRRWLARSLLPSGSRWPSTSSPHGTFSRSSVRKIPALVLAHCLLLSLALAPQSAASRPPDGGFASHLPFSCRSMQSSAHGRASAGAAGRVGRRAPAGLREPRPAARPARGGRLDHRELVVRSRACRVRIRRRRGSGGRPRRPTPVRAVGDRGAVHVASRRPLPAQARHGRLRLRSAPSPWASLRRRSRSMPLPPSCLPSRPSRRSRRRPTTRRSGRSSPRSRAPRTS